MGLSITHQRLTDVWPRSFPELKIHYKKKTTKKPIKSITLSATVCGSLFSSFAFQWRNFKTQEAGFPYPLPESLPLELFCFQLLGFKNLFPVCVYPRFLSLVWEILDFHRLPPPHWCTGQLFRQYITTGPDIYVYARRFIIVICASLSSEPLPPLQQRKSGFHIRSLSHTTGMEAILSVIII